MKLKNKYLRNKYLKLFDYNEYKYNFVITDLKFTFDDIYSIIKKNDYKDILEIGSGTGFLLNELKIVFPNKNFTGIDPGESGFQNYKDIFFKNLNLNKKIKFYDQSINKFKTKKKYDLIFSFNVFEHIKNQKLYLKNSYSKLKDGGKLIIYAPNYDFPYEPHFLIPIIYNKSITKKIFKKKIKIYEKKTGEKGLWEGLNLTGKTKIEEILKKNKFNYYFDKKIKDKMISRIFNDIFFFKRQGIAAIITKFAVKIYLDKIIFDFLKIPFPYYKLVIKKK